MSTSAYLQLAVHNCCCMTMILVTFCCFWPVSCKQFPHAAVAVPAAHLAMLLGNTGLLSRNMSSLCFPNSLKHYPLRSDSKQNMTHLATQDHSSAVNMYISLFALHSAPTLLHLGIAGLLSADNLDLPHSAIYLKAPANYFAFLYKLENQVRPYLQPVCNCCGLNLQ